MIIPEQVHANDEFKSSNKKKLNINGQLDIATRYWEMFQRYLTYFHEIVIKGAKQILII